MSAQVTTEQLRIRHITSVQQFQKRSILTKLFSEADWCEKIGRSRTLTGKTLATIFYEPSTRTRLSFETAMYRLGGNVITSENAGISSSSTKGESLADTVRIIAGYADAIVLRHPDTGSAQHAAAISPVPIINAGDGSGEHPTQALLDLYTIQRELGRIDNLKIAIVGDLLYGRTVHSLLMLLAVCKNVKIYLVSPPQLRIPEEYTQELQVHQITSLSQLKEKVDVLYVTRIQTERFDALHQSSELQQPFVVNVSQLVHLKKNGILMHPLPRAGEISPEVDVDSRAAYFRQAQYGGLLRMALLKQILV